MTTVRRVEYKYLGLASFVESHAPEPNVTWSIMGSGEAYNPYTGLDRFGRVIDCKWTHGSSPVEEVLYAYDRASNRTSRHNAVAPDGGNDELYAYDGVQRLTDMSRGDLIDGNAAIDNLSFGQTWKLDATGNWSGFTSLDVDTPTNNLDQQRTSNQANEITDVARRYGANWVTPAYDRAGNMTTIPGGNDPTVTMNGVYDAWNRLVSIPETASYSYDGLNRRTTTTVGSTVRHAYYTSSWQNIEERVGTSTTPDRQFIWGLRYLDDLVLRDRSTTGTLNERLYGMQDANWNVTAIVDATGAVKERYRYSAYGVPTFHNADFTTRSLGGNYQWETLYAGYRWDASSGLYQVRWRYLNPVVGLWITRDPVGYIGGLNLSSYAYCAPIDNSDLLGALVGAPLNPGSPHVAAAQLGYLVGTLLGDPLGRAIGDIIYAEDTYETVCCIFYNTETCQRGKLETVCNLPVSTPIEECCEGLEEPQWEYVFCYPFSCQLVPDNV